MSTAENIAWGASGLLSFIALIAWLRWEGPREYQKKDEPLPGCRMKQNAKQRMVARSLHDPSISFPRSLTTETIFLAVIRCPLRVTINLGNNGPDLGD